MSAFKLWCRRMLGLPEVDITNTDLNLAYQMGFQNGKACGEIGGREAAIRELELLLASRGKMPADFESADLTLLRQRTFH